MTQARIAAAHQSLAEAAGAGLDADALRERLAEVASELDAALAELAAAQEALDAQATALVRHEQETTRAQSRFRAIFDFAPEGYVVTDVEGSIREANLAAAALLGVDVERLTKKPFFVFVPLGARAALRREVTALRHGLAMQTRLRIPLTPRKGRVRDVEVLIVVRSLVHGEPAEMLWHIHDLEPVLRAERAEEEAAALRAANETKGELLALISHELRTPLTVIVGHAAGMRRAQSANEDVAVRASEIQEQATRLQGMIENMLSLLLIEQEERKELEPVLLQPEIERAIQHHRLRYPDREIIVHALPESSTVMADELAIGHVLENLIENAEKYSDEATAIEIEVEDDGEMARVRVCDRGIGLTAQEAETVFRPFYRARMARQRTPGMGLGLVVVRRLLDAMGGTISAAPREGGGSTFSFALPLALRADEAELQPGNVP